jgi:hypothetical protein
MGSKFAILFSAIMSGGRGGTALCMEVPYRGHAIWFQKLPPGARFTYCATPATYQRQWRLWRCSFTFPQGSQSVMGTDHLWRTSAEAMEGVLGDVLEL